MVLSMEMADRQRLAIFTFPHQINVNKMATLTAYQLQFRQRMKRAISLRAVADRKARAHARLLAAALTDAATAADMMNRLNQTYNVDVSTQTLLVHTLTEKVGGQLLPDALGESQPGEEGVLFNQVPDANGGQFLPADAVFGEFVGAGPTKQALSTPGGLVAREAETGVAAPAPQGAPMA